MSSVMWGRMLPAETWQTLTGNVCRRPTRDVLVTAIDVGRASLIEIMEERYYEDALQSTGNVRVSAESAVRVTLYVNGESMVSAVACGGDITDIDLPFGFPDIVAVLWGCDTRRPLCVSLAPNVALSVERVR